MIYTVNNNSKYFSGTSLDSMQYKCRDKIQIKRIKISCRQDTYVILKWTLICSELELLENDFELNVMIEKISNNYTLSEEILWINKTARVCITSTIRKRTITSNCK